MKQCTDFKLNGQPFLRWNVHRLLDLLRFHGELDHACEWIDKVNPCFQGIVPDGAEEVDDAHIAGRDDSEHLRERNEREQQGERAGNERRCTKNGI